MTPKEFNAKFGRLEFHLEWRLTLFAVILVPLMAYLGFWQLDRADEKRGLAARHARQTSLPPISLEALFTQLRPIWAGNQVQDIATTTDPEQHMTLGKLADRSVRFSGEFEPKRYLLQDNRIQKGQFGYEVIALVRAEDVLIPVNLGWIAGDPARQTQPNPDLPTGEFRFDGRIYIPQSDAYLLAEQPEPNTLPVVVQDFSARKLASPLARLTGLPVVPVMVHIDPASPVAKSASWVLMNQSPEKHTGYAVQWFTMASVLLIAFVLRSSNIIALLRGQ